MHYLVYQITNLINGKIYIGAHKTSVIDDGYMSSSSLVKAAIKKHGLGNFKKEILHECESSKEMFNKEAELVDKVFCKRSDTYNIKCGGFGGWSHWNDGSELHRNTSRKVAIANRKKYGNPSEGKLLAHNFALNPQHQTLACNKAATEKAKIKRIATIVSNGGRGGYRNSQFGRCWVFRQDVGTIRVLSNDVNHYLAQGYVRGKISKTDRLCQGARYRAKRKASKLGAA